MKDHPKLRVGLFGIGLDAYWPQFEGLEARLKGYLQRVAEKLRRPDVDVVSLGLIDTPQKALSPGHELRRAADELVRRPALRLGREARGVRGHPRGQRVGQFLPEATDTVVGEAETGQRRRLQPGLLGEPPLGPSGVERPRAGQQAQLGPMQTVATGGRGQPGQVRGLVRARVGQEVQVRGGGQADDLQHVDA